MYRDDFSEDPYEPDEQELEEINEMLRRDDEEQLLKKKTKNRLIREFTTQSHFAGWLKVNGIKW